MSASASFPGLPPPPPPSEPVLAAAVVLYRDTAQARAGAREVVLVKRGARLRFGAGWHAFPGGRLDPADADVEIPGLGGREAALVVCAVREVFEETGVLLARGAEHVPATARVEARRALLDGSLAFPAFLAALGLSLDAGALVPAGRWVTPEHLPLRYDAHVFLAALPPGEAAEIWPGELAEGGLVPVADALARWSRGEALLHPPNLNALQVLARPGPIDLEALRHPPHHRDGVSTRIEFQEGLFLAPLRTPTLPPASHTNTWLVPFEDGLAAVDPGAWEPAEQEKLFAIVDGLAADGHPLRAVWLTHGHADHVGAVVPLAARYGVPVLGHPLVAARLPEPWPVQPLGDGDRLGRFRVLATPGHAREHLAFLDETTGALIAGDMVSTLSTIVIEPAEGDMAEYMRQLARLRDLAPRTLYPAHGPPAPGAAAQLGAFLEHRRMREQLVIRALATPGPLAEITARAYADTPAALHPVAERSCLASLLKLQAEGVAREDGERWSFA